MATKANIILDQGTTFLTTITVENDEGEPINLADYTCRAQMRKHYTSSNAVSFTAEAGADGNITLSLTANQTSNIIPGRYVYDVEVISNTNTVTRLVEGIVTVTPEVTR
jgi:hypothetical protein